MRQDAQKRAPKFCTSKRAENTKMHPVWAKKDETGCVLGAGEGCGRCGRVGEPEIRTKVNHITLQHMQKENRRKPSVFAGFLAGAEGLVSAAASVGPGRSPPGCRPPRHALRGAQPCLVAKTFRPVTKNSATAKAVALFLAGAEGLEPSERGFGVDVETQQREQERGSVDGFSRRSHKRVVLVWCCKGFSRSECSQKTG